MFNATPNIGLEPKTAQRPSWRQALLEYPLGLQTQVVKARAGSRHLELFSLPVNDLCWGQKPKLLVNPQNLSTWIKRLWCIHTLA